MDEQKTESRNAKLLRQLNEEFDADKEVVKGMSKDEKRVLGILLVAAVVIAAVLMAVWSGLSRAGEMTVDIQCPKDASICFGSKKDFMALIEHNNAVTQKLADVMATRAKCDLSKS